MFQAIDGLVFTFYFKFNFFPNILGIKRSYVSGTLRLARVLANTVLRTTKVLIVRGEISFNTAGSLLRAVLWIV